MYTMPVTCGQRACVVNMFILAYLTNYETNLLIPTKYAN